jgi:hypothetical protein
MKTTVFFRSGAVESCPTIEVGQALTERCGPLSPFDAKGEFSAAPAPHWLRTEIYAARMDLLRWAQTQSPELRAAAEIVAAQLYVHASSTPPSSRRGLVSAVERLRAA